MEPYALLNSARYFGTWSYTDSYYYSCSSSGYSSLTSCSRRSRPSSSYTVTQMIKLDYGVQQLLVITKLHYFVITRQQSCSYTIYVLRQTCIFIYCAACSRNGAVRLVGGQSSNEGRLEYCYNGAWTQFCHASFQIEEAVAACRQLGYTNPSKNLQLRQCTSTSTIHSLMQKQVLLLMDDLDKDQTIVWFITSAVLLHQL